MRIALPGDKSITHRALLIAGMLRRQSEIRNALMSDDTRSTARVLRCLAVRVSPLRRGRVVQVKGCLWRSPSKTLQCGNSGTTARLVLGALSGIQIEAAVDGDSSLRGRPMERVTNPLAEMGARFEKRGKGTLPLTVRGGNLRSIDFVSPVASAQVKSALLLAGVTGRTPVAVEEPYRSRDHTERLLSHLGVDIAVIGPRVEMAAPPIGWERALALDIDVPGDPSSAAFLIAAAVLAGKREFALEGVCVNPTRIGFLKVLQSMGVAVDFENRASHHGEPVADLLAYAGALKGTEISPSQIPGLIDEIPVLSVLAARAEGDTVIRSAGELRVKESNRLEGLAGNLREIGAEAEVSGDDLWVGGSDHPLGGRVDTKGDHRIAMAFAVMNCAPNVSVELSEYDSPGISYPGFFEDLNAVNDYV